MNGLGSRGNTLLQSLKWNPAVLGLAKIYPSTEICKMYDCWRVQFASHSKKTEDEKLFVVRASSDGDSL